MSTIKDIARIIAERHSVKIGASEEFLQQMVKVINEGLLNDRIVKIKGLGTFKLQEVKERSSVNVNTGERVVIAAHDKISFTPENVMKDVINKPFAHFETVIMNGDAEIETTEEQAVEVTPEMTVIPETLEEPKELETQKIPEIPKEPEISETPEITEVPEEPENPESPATEPIAALAAEPIDEHDNVEAAEHDDVVDVVDNVVDNDEHRSYTIYYVIIINVLIALISFVLGYLACKNGWIEGKDTVKVEVVKETERQHLVKEKVTTKEVVAQPNTTKANTTKVPEKEVQPTEKKDDLTQYSQYDSDPRIKHGAYVILGLDKEVKVQQGQTLKGISKAYLGEGMECYVEAFNNGKKEVAPGDVVRIPKLKTKRSLKK